MDRGVGSMVKLEISLSVAKEFQSEHWHSWKVCVKVFNFAFDR